MVSPTVVKIAELNDQFRRCDPSVPGMRFLTAGIIELLKRHKRDGDKIVQIVSEFNVFTEDNDPHGEHDFGTFEYLGETCFWKRINCQSHAALVVAQPISSAMHTRVGTRIPSNGCFTAVMTGSAASTVMWSPSAWISQSEQFFAGKFSQELS